MRIQTYSVLIGNRKCNARCPYCVSKMTPAQGVDSKKSKINWRNFNIGCQFAQNNEVSTILLTGKGEPLLFPKEITAFLKHLKPYKFPFIELQTNGILIFQKRNLYKKYLKEWYQLGLTTIAISIVHYKDEKNKIIYQPEGSYMKLVDLIKIIHSAGLSVRFSCTMLKNFIDSPTEVKKLVNFAKENKVEQISTRSLEKPIKSENKEISQWVAKHQINETQLRNYLKNNAVEVMKLVHGATVYDLDGQNICLTNALTLDPSSEELRQLIFFPDGHLRYDWQYPGANLI
ncbi:MAG: radical SAM protein [Patescibacteria group bacterium]|nr:radical SAM protein [Patescibacteria group bacterium]MDD5164880.1 radical SAM protein [Patescibacteria group bacterium]MDD5534662.1 radical SAM protein [Patescibacteria group bacterium]